MTLVTEMQLETTNWNLLWLDKSENHNHSRVLNHIAFVSVITTRKKHKWLRKLLHLYSTSMSFQKFLLSWNKGNIKNVPLSTHVRVLISDDGPMLQVHEVTEGSNNARKPNIVMRRLNNSKKGDHYKTFLKITITYVKKKCKENHNSS